MSPTRTYADLPTTELYRLIAAAQSAQDACSTETEWFEEARRIETLRAVLDEREADRREVA